MPAFVIVETQNGYTIVDQPENALSEAEIIGRYGGLVVDPGPYRTYEEACDALLALEREAAEDAEHELGG